MPSSFWYNMTMIVTIPIKTEKDIATPGPTVLVLGYFDGIHLGHQNYLALLVKLLLRRD